MRTKDAAVPSLGRLFQEYQIDERQARAEDKRGGYTVQNLRSHAADQGLDLTRWCDWHIMGLFLMFYFTAQDNTEEAFFAALVELSS